MALNKFLFIYLLCVLNAYNLIAQTFTLKPKAKETDIVLVNSNAYFYIDRNDVIVLMKDLCKRTKQDYSLYIKKMKGHCFESVHLEKSIDDPEITAITAMLNNDLILMGLKKNKFAIKEKKSDKFYKKASLNFIDMPDFGINKTNKKKIYLIDENKNIIIELKDNQC